MEKLIFGRANKKLIKLEKKTGKKLFTFSLLAGHSCPGASLCHASIIEIDGKRKLVDGPNAVFRCFSASQEALFTNVYESRKKNMELLKECGNSVKKMTELILSSLPRQAEMIRVGVSGDYYTYNYFLAWCEVAKLNPDILFYGYTKSVTFLIKAKEKGLLPKNLKITCSIGGRWDDLIKKNNLKFAEVVYSDEEAKEKGLEIDEDDSHAALSNKSFGLKIHSVGKPGSRQQQIYTAKHKKTKAKV